MPLRSELARDVGLVRCPYEMSPMGVKEPLRKLTGATVRLNGAAAMRTARIEGVQGCPKLLRHGFGITGVIAVVPLPTLAAVLGHADIAMTAIYTTAAGVEARAFLEKIWDTALQG